MNWRKIKQNWQPILAFAGITVLMTLGIFVVYEFSSPLVLNPNISPAARQQIIDQNCFCNAFDPVNLAIVGAVCVVAILSLTIVIRKYPDSFKGVKQKQSGIGREIAIFFLGLILFSFIWAIYGFEVFPQYQIFQVTYYPSGVYPVDQLSFVGQMVIWFPLIVIWSSVLWLWANAQNKTSPGDYPIG